MTDRLLVTPTRRWPLIAGRLGQNAVQALIQSLVIVGMALAIGVSFDGGLLGVVALVLVAILLGTAFAALSNALALVARQEESLIGAVTFLQLPLTFLSTAFMQEELIPGWVAAVAEYNPVNWAVVAGREAVDAEKKRDPHELGPAVGVGSQAWARSALRVDSRLQAGDQRRQKGPDESSDHGDRHLAGDSGTGRLQR